MAALAAAAIANEDPFIIAFDAVRLAAVGFLVPFVFLWNPAILGQGSGFEIALIGLGGIVGACAVAVSFEWIGRVQFAALSWPLRLLLVLGAAASVAPITFVAITGILVSLGLMAIALRAGKETVAVTGTDNADMAK